MTNRGISALIRYMVIVTLEKISEGFMLPALGQLLRAFPFKIQGFHADNGGEYSNDTVAKLLAKLRIEFTKSRPRQSNDNALVESKNGSVVRKPYGYSHMLGLMGTLIPLGPGLSALGEGNLQILTTAMTVAFDTTVMSLFTGIVGFILGRSLASSSL